MSYSYYRQPPGWNQQQDESLRRLVMQKVTNGLILAGLVSIGVVVLGLPPIFFFVFLVAEIVAIIGYFFAKSEGTIEKLYYTFVVSSAGLLGYTLQSVLFTIDNGMVLIFNAFALTAVIFGGIYYYTEANRPDVSNMTKYLFPAILILFVVMIAGIFITFSNTFNLVISVFGALLFTAYLYYDLGRLMNQQYMSPARMAFQIYWDVLLIFKFILRALVLSSRD